MVMRPEEAEVPLVREAMSKDLNYSDPDTSVCDIARTLRSDDRGSVIIKEGDEIKGMVTNSDVVNDFVVAGKGDKARDIMTKEIITISPGMDIEDAAMIMVEEGIERLVVMEGGDLIGIISQDDIMKVRPRLYLDITQGHKLGAENVEMEFEEREVGKCESCENYSESLGEVNGNLLCAECREEMNFA